MSHFEANWKPMGFWKRISMVCLLVGSMACKEAPKQWTDQTLQVACGQARNMLKGVKKAKQFPRSIERGLRPSQDWTSGFYPGEMWYLYEYTGDAYWKEQAQEVTQWLEKEQYSTNDHDIGFRIYCSYGNGWRLTGNKEYAKVVVRAAQSLCTRYNPKVKALMSWNPKSIKNWTFPVIIDNMMNLELLFEATRISGDSTYYHVARNHALTTMANHYRSDYSCPHVVDYDTITGKRIKMDFNNGYNATSAWSRGQGWSVYGYTMTYRETGDPQFLHHAEKVAEFILNNPNMPEDLVPYWDYRAPEIPTKRDASAGALTASALLELSQYSENGAKYFQAGEKMLKSLTSPEYLAKAGTNGNFLVKHCTGNFRKSSEVDGTLIYGDYYLVEALLRYQKIKKGKKLYQAYLRKAK